MLVFGGYPILKSIFLGGLFHWNVPYPRTGLAFAEASLLLLVPHGTACHASTIAAILLALPSHLQTFGRFTFAGRVFRGRLKSIPWNLRDLKGQGFPTKLGVQEHVLQSAGEDREHVKASKGASWKLKGTWLSCGGCLKIRGATENPVEMIHFKVESFEDT